MIVGDTITLEIQKLNSEGEGIGKFDNFGFYGYKTPFPYENFGYAEIQEILNSAPERITPKCKLHKICGACNLQHISYEAQLKYKKEILNDTLKNVLPKDFQINNLIGEPDGYSYRAKIQYPVGSPKNNKRILAGYYKISRWNPSESQV